MQHDTDTGEPSTALKTIYREAVRNAHHTPRTWLEQHGERISTAILETTPEPGTAENVPAYVTARDVQAHLRTTYDADIDIRAAKQTLGALGHLDAAPVEKVSHQSSQYDATGYTTRDHHALTDALAYAPVHDAADTFGIDTLKRTVLTILDDEPYESRVRAQNDTRKVRRKNGFYRDLLNHGP